MKLDVIEQIKTFQDFIEAEYKTQLLENARKGNNFILINFSDLSKFDIDLASELLSSPEETIKAIEKSIEQFDIDELTNCKVCIAGLPETSTIKIRDIRSSHLGRFYNIYGVVRQLSEIIPTISYVKYECPVCGNVMGVISQNGSKLLKEPTRCACGRKGNFFRIGREMIDMQRLVIEEASENLEGNQQPKRLGVIMKGNHLTNPSMEGITRPGNRVVITGILYDNPKFLKNIETVEREFVLEANYIKPMDDEFLNIVITPEDEKQIIELSQRKDLNEYLVSKYSPTIFGNEIIKEAIILQQFGGVTFKTKTTKELGEIHILLIGDTGLGKSRIIKFAMNFAPKSYFASGDTSSGVGITFAVEKDEFLQTWALKAGTMVLSHKGLAIVDELDKLDEDDTQRMHSALASGEIVVNKASINNVTLMCETALLSACNPKNSRFDPYIDDLSSQIELPITLINRFDLIFPMQEKIDEETDRKIALKMMGALRNSNENINLKEYDLIKKYIMYARKISPEIPPEIEKMVAEFYVKMRQRKNNSTKAVPITARQLASLNKIMQASARRRLSNKANEDDFNNASRILMYYLEKLALDPETGTFDIARVETGLTTKTRNNIKIILEVIKNLANSFGKSIPMDDIVLDSIKHGIEEDEIEATMEKLKNSGDIFEPRRGFITVI